MQIKITRKKHFFSFGKNHPLQVCENGNTIGKIYEGEEKKFECTCEATIISFEDLGMSSNSIFITNKSQGYIEVDTWLYGWKCFFTLILILFASSFYRARFIEKK